MAPRSDTPPTFADTPNTTGVGIKSSDWAQPVRATLSRARRIALEATGTTDMKHMCVVWEVERAVIARGSASTWKQPFMPMDLEQQHRWQDRGLQRRHPLLSSNEDWSVASQPPIVMLPIWKPAGPWTPVVSDETDQDGWQYGTDWNASVWRKCPRAIFDSVRRRKWQREYCLSESSDKFIDRQWLQNKQMKHG